MPPAQHSHATTTTQTQKGNTSSYAAQRRYTYQRKTSGHENIGQLTIFVSTRVEHMPPAVLSGRTNRREKNEDLRNTIRPAADEETMGK